MFPKPVAMRHQDGADRVVIRPPYCPLGARSRTLLIQRGLSNPLNSGNWQAFTQGRVVRCRSSSPQLPDFAGLSSTPSNQGPGTTTESAHILALICGLGILLPASAEAQAAPPVSSTGQRADGSYSTAASKPLVAQGGCPSTVGVNRLAHDRRDKRERLHQCRGEWRMRDRGPMILGGWAPVTRDITADLSRTGFFPLEGDRSMPVPIPTRTHRMVLATRAAAVGALLLVAASGSVAGQPGARVRDSTGWQLISRTEALGGVGILAAAFIADGDWRTEVQEIRSNTTNRLATLGNALGNGKYVLPPLAVLYLGGRLTHQRGITAAALHTGVTFLFAGAASVVLKEAVGRARPSQGGDPTSYRPFSGFDSFPSGHSTVAFAVAASLASHTHHLWVRTLLYAGASLTGFARMNDDKHWLSDVIAGAAVGILASRVTAHVAGTGRLGPASSGLGLRLSF
jgi:membrane-associated phospholipid phosphatase